MKLLTKHLMKGMARTARPHLKALGLLRTSKVFHRSALVWDPADERVLVLAPHMDDETLGCGGALALHASRGATIKIVFLTDGAAEGALTAEARRERHDVRRAEGREATRVLGVEDVEFHDAPDGALASWPQSAVRLRGILESFRPQIVYLPHFVEEHPDHRATSAVLAAACEGLAANFQCLGYEVWTPLFPNCLVNIDDVVERKRQAIERYPSQLADADYAHTVMGLAAYRSAAMQGGTCRFAEAFCSLPVDEYLREYRRWGVDR